MKQHQKEAVILTDGCLKNEGLPTYSELLALLMRSEDCILARSPGASVAPDIRAALGKAGIERGKLAAMPGLRL